jgi:uncharacterized protein (DUF427 family)
MTELQATPRKVKKYDIMTPTGSDEYVVVIEDSPRRVRAMFNGATIADSVQMKMMHETRHIPVYYFPIEDVDMSLLTRTDHSTHCPHKGDASYWSVNVGDKTAENAVWTYENPMDHVPDLKGLVGIYWSEMDHWYEEDEEIVIHARDPYKRIDTVLSKRHVEVKLGGEIVASSKAATFLFETGMPTRYYIPKEDVRADVLSESDLRTGCPYKGNANYYSVDAGGKTFENIVWYYPDPIAEIPKIKDLLCFFNEKVDAIHVDGVEIPKQRSPWSED